MKTLITFWRTVWSVPLFASLMLYLLLYWITHGPAALRALLANLPDED